MSELTLNAYQLAAVRTVNTGLDDDDRLLDAACGLVEEGGEVLAEVRKHVMQGRPLDRPALTEELGDALWCIAALARTLDIPLDDVAVLNLDKLRARHPDGFVDHQSSPPPPP